MKFKEYLTEIGFSSRESFLRYRSQHKMRPSTMVVIDGKRVSVASAQGAYKTEPVKPGDGSKFFGKNKPETKGEEKKELLGGSFFDDVVDSAPKLSDDTKSFIKNIEIHKATRSNYEKFKKIAMADKNLPKSVKSAMDDIDNNRTTGEFKFRFSDQRHQSSAVQSLFDLFHQALTYNNNEI